ncbi:MAG: NuoM family protein [Cytophagaceae bacterium]
MSEYLLTIIIALPLAGLPVILSLPKSKTVPAKYISICICILQVLLTSYLFISGHSGSELQFVEKRNWIHLDLGTLGVFSANYFLGADGLNISLLLLSAIVLLASSIAACKIEDKIKGYQSLFLILNASVIGCFSAQDFLLFFLFFEFMLLPMYFLIGLWGGPRKEYASIKFFLYTLAGSLLILIVLIALYFSAIDPAKTALNAGLVNDITEVDADIIFRVQTMLQNHQLSSAQLVHTFSFADLADINNFIPGSLMHVLSETTILGISVRMAAFLALLIGFAIKLPAVPFHTWLPDAHVEAPTPVSVLLAGILLKIGGYGILRTAFFIFPEGLINYSFMIGLIGVISIIYGGLNALAMKDLKKLIAYSSVSHMGFVFLGIASGTPEGMNGAIFLMFSHGILSSGLFLIAGVIYDRTGDRLIDNYRGLASKLPIYTTVVTIVFFASLGLPGFSGFIAELLILLGAFKSETTNTLLPQWMPVLATLGILIGAAYLLWTLQRMFFGKFQLGRSVKIKSGFEDLNGRELSLFIPIVILTICLGVFPSLLLDKTGSFASDFINEVISKGNENIRMLSNLKKIF